MTTQPQTKLSHLDWADNLALDVWADALGNTHGEALKKIAARLRELHREGYDAGMNELAEQLERRAQEHGTC